MMMMNKEMRGWEKRSKGGGESLLSHLTCGNLNGVAALLSLV